MFQGEIWHLSVVTVGLHKRAKFGPDQSRGVDTGPPNF